LALPNAWDVVSARILEELGHPAITTTARLWRFSLGYTPMGENIAAKCWMLWRDYAFGACRSLLTWSLAAKRRKDRWFTRAMVAAGR
jgi:hypothetical protein